ncbi:hypothetical protein ABTZ03_26105 [Kitasatospora sp. NPDC096077]|uniref:hypothetical protein n=1 Tax=Kitasatospora sp. NPDC096077 TaxID=3155544 RepID=UPI003323E14C
MNPAGPPYLLAALRQEVRAEDHLFHLVDTAAPRTGDPDDQPPTPERGTLATVGAGAATLNSALADHYPDVTLELWSGQPPDLAGPPADHIRLAVALDGGRLALCSGVSHLPAPRHLTVPPGRYNLDAWRSAPTDTRRPVGAEAIPHSAEHWLLRLWLSSTPGRDDSSLLDPGSTRPRL